MHLMYYLNEKGERVYTLKVSGGPASASRAAAVTLAASALVFYRRRRTRRGSPRTLRTQVREISALCALSAGSCAPGTANRSCGPLRSAFLPG